MKKIVLMALLAAFTAACATPDINEDTEAYGTDKSKSVNSKGDSQDHELEDELDITEN